MSSLKNPLSDNFPAYYLYPRHSNTKKYMNTLFEIFEFSIKNKNKAEKSRYPSLRIKSIPSKEPHSPWLIAIW